ncbi:hypothetical protein DFQ28_006795 [Apophysomyces sp. BC1034]|nr:hypothetical protein DFQ30_008100 [Apophysomyces sp. BC1015]KAG0176825.1 hypothetical protein DFQ29_005584 [Apophysomyces sp. BC1021]KAG0187163.1 hypothetical protein DFQ28_006795 [Apophysomyces sp. BC1034]
MIQIMESSYDDFMKDISTTFITDEQDRINFGMAQDYYKSCINETTLDALGPTPIYPELGRMLSKFPGNHPFELADVADLTDVLIAVYDQGIEPFSSMFIGPDDTHPDTIAITLSQPDLVLPSKEYYEQPEVIDIYRKSLVSLFKAVLGRSNCTTTDALRFTKANEANLTLLTDTEIVSLVDRVIDFDIYLANITYKQEDLQDPVKNYNVMPLSQIQKAYTNVDWSRFLQHFVPKDQTLPTSLVVPTPQYFEKLAAWFQDNLSTQTIHEFILMRNIVAKVYALDSNTRSIMRKMHSAIASGTTAPPFRSRVCIQATSSTFGPLMGRYYTMKKFGGDTERSQVQNFVDMIHQAWLKRLPQMDWLDPETRKRAIDKVNKIKHKLGYPVLSPDTRSPSSLGNYFSSIQIDQTSYFKNEQSTTKWILNKGWNKLGKPVDKDEWLMSSQDVNAYYTPNYNEAFVPAGILQSVFYEKDSPESLNYGGIGMVIGHELTHAFDNSGRHFDGDGNLKDWWTPTTAGKFDAKSQCFVKQYGEFHVQGPDNKPYNVNGKMTLGENLADNGGLSVAYMAYKQAAKDKSEQKRLPGLQHLSSDALFFVNFGRMWCTRDRSRMAVQRVLTDVHSPNRFRVNGALQNSKDFAQVFQCKPGSPMNPQNKCELW